MHGVGVFDGVGVFVVVGDDDGVAVFDGVGVLLGVGVSDDIGLGPGVGGSVGAAVGVRVGTGGGVEVGVPVAGTGVSGICVKVGGGVAVGSPGLGVTVGTGLFIPSITSVARAAASLDSGSRSRIANSTIRMLRLWIRPPKVSWP